MGPFVMGLVQAIGFSFTERFEEFVGSASSKNVRTRQYRYPMARLVLTGVRLQVNLVVIS
jgi:hypothetical protein